MESWEFALRRAVLSGGAEILSRFLEEFGSGRQGGPMLCPCGCRMKSRGKKKKRIKTILGEIEFKRAVFVCPSCGTVRVPADELLDVVGTGFSPGVRRLMARAGQRGAFREGRDDLDVFAEILVSAKDVERVAEGTGQKVEAWQAEERAALLEGREEPAAGSKTIPRIYVSCDGTGVPMVQRELAGRKGKQPNGGSKTREVKLGCVFTQTGTDEKGFPIRDEDSTTFVGAIETAAEFGSRLYAEALRRGLRSAEEGAFLADGARYNWDIADLHFPGFTQIVDLYHAREHLHDLCVLMLPKGERDLLFLEMRWRTMLDEGRVLDIVDEARASKPKSGQRRRPIEREIGYFMNNAHRMRYDVFRARGFFVGSGVIEAGCKTVVAKRLKQSGMKWSLRGANSIIALRCAHLAGRMEDFWERDVA